MPMSFSILPKHNLVYVHCTGFVDVPQTLESFEAYSKHPDFVFGQSQLIDLSDVTDYDRDFLGIMSLQAQNADAYLGLDKRPFLIFVAPNELTRSMAMTALRSWSNLDEGTGVIPLMVSSVKEAMDVLEIRDLETNKFVSASFLQD